MTVEAPPTDTSSTATASARQGGPAADEGAIEVGAARRGESVSIRRTLRELPVLFFVALLIAFLVKTFLAQAFYIPSSSMVPQLQLYDRVVVSKPAYKFHAPHRGDIVVFDAPRGSFQSEPERSTLRRLWHFVGERIGLVQPSTDEFIKRVIGVPGETVQGKDGKVWIDGRELREPYLPEGVYTSDFGPLTVPKGMLWVMGDNRSNSADSRFFGPIEQDTVVGRAIVRVWPPSRASFL